VYIKSIFDSAKQGAVYPIALSWKRYKDLAEALKRYLSFNTQSRIKFLDTDCTCRDPPPQECEQFPSYTITLQTLEGVLIMFAQLFPLFPH
jgi:hypothetical protein